MNKRTKSLSIAAALAVSALVLQAPIAGAADYGSNDKAQAADSQNGVPGVDLDVGKNASDRGIPGVELNVGRDGDQKNVNTDTHTLGAGSDMTAQDSDAQSPRPLRTDRN